MSDNREFASSSDGRPYCMNCRRSWPAETLSCLSCSAELHGETVLDDLGTNALSSLSVTPLGDTILNKIPLETTASTASAAPVFADSSDERHDRVTRKGPRKPSVAKLVVAGKSSSNPRTRVVRNVDQHIELPSGSIVDDYEIDTRLGEGAMGVVYGAKHVKLGRRVAIKVISPRMGKDPQALARFEREARALASLQHPNIVDVSAFGTLPDRRSYFVMEYLVGET